MVWYVPIGVYEGVKTTSEIADPTIDLSADAPDAKHVALRVGTGTIPAPIEYDTVLSFLATRAPNEIYLQEWLTKGDDPPELQAQFEELIEDGIVMSFGEYPLDDSRMAGRLAVKASSINRVEHDEDDSSIWVDAGRGELLAEEALVDVVDGMTTVPVPLEDVYARFAAALPDDVRQFAARAFDGSLQSLVQTGAVTIMLRQ